MISVCIPCHEKHIIHLQKLLHNIINQTLKPKQIIIIISEYKSINTNDVIIEKLFDIIKDTNIELIIKKYFSVQYANTNRKIATELVTGDIIVFQDADDIPHKQRLEIINYFFMKFDCVHLLHGWKNFFTNNNLNIHEIEYINIISSNNFPFNIKKNNKNLCIHNGVLSFKTCILKDIVWNNLKKGQDVELNKFIIDKFKNTILLDNYNIYNYRNELSSWN